MDDVSFRIDVIQDRLRIDREGSGEDDHFTVLREFIQETHETRSLVHVSRLHLFSGLDDDCEVMLVTGGGTILHLTVVVLGTLEHTVDQSLIHVQDDTQTSLVDVLLRWEESIRWIHIPRELGATTTVEGILHLHSTIL